MKPVAMAAGLVQKLVFGNAAVFKRYMNLYRPYVGAGIRVARVSKDFREIDVQLARKVGNGNAFGTHFGGSLYAMTDPFYVLMFVAILGDGYVIWDKSAKIDFIRPGRGTVTAKFRLSESDIAAARAATAGGAKYLPVFVVEITDAAGASVARIEKELYLRRKPARRPREKTTAA
ncbi:MAG: hotdog fold domain-containing protein [Nevskia sp.]